MYNTPQNSIHYLRKIKFLKFVDYERRKHSSAFKAKVAIEALKERESLQELSHRFEVSQNQVSKWKSEFLSKSSQLFEQSSKSASTVDVSTLYAKIGELEMEKEFLKKT